jgi:hypothetical protein
MYLELQALDLLLRGSLLVAHGRQLGLRLHQGVLQLLHLRNRMAMYRRRSTYDVEHSNAFHHSS